MDTDLRKRLGLAGEECGRVQHQTDMIFTPDPVIDAHRQEILNDVAANAVEPDALPVKSQGNCDHESLPLRPVGSRFAGHLVNVQDGVFLPTQLHLSYPLARINNCSDNRRALVDAPTPPIPPTNPTSLTPEQRNIAHLPVTAPSVTDNGSVHSTVLRDPSPPILDDPSFHDFLESIPESDPTTLQSLLSQEALNENILPKQNSFFSTTGITELGSNAESASPANEDVAGRINVIKTGSIVRPPPTASNHSISLHRTHLLSNGKRKLPSLEEMRNDNCILRLSLAISSAVFPFQSFIHQAFGDRHYTVPPFRVPIPAYELERILAHLKSGKIHTMPKDSPAATELAIDLGTLFLLISYGPAHLRSMCRPVSTDDSWPTPGCSEGTMTRSPENPEATNKITSYIISELDRWLGPEGTGRFQDRQLPFKARTLPDRWAFLQDYLSHWVDKVGLCSTNTPSVVSSLVLAYRLCRMDLVDTRSNRGVHHRLMNHRPTPPLRPRIPENLHYLSTLCRQMQDQWTPQKATEISHGYLADKKVVVWHLIALWDLNSRPKQEEEEESTTDKQDLTRLPDMFPPAVRMQATSAQALESQLRMMHRLCTESSEEMDVIKQQWQAISHDIKLPTPVEQEWLKAYQRVRQITLESFLKRSWT
ncbi:hypothetical protein PG995_005711 [Apiospora arundinis]